MATNETQKAAAETKKKGKGSKIPLVTFLIVAILGPAYYVVTNYVLTPKHEIRIEGKTIEMTMSVQDLYDNGFVLCNVVGKITDVPDAYLKAKEIDEKMYYIGIPESKASSKCTGVQITLANFTSGDQKYSECTIYQISYEPAFHDDGLDVKIDGEDMKTGDIEKWVSFFKAKKYPFKSKDLKDFTAGKTNYIRGSRGTYKFNSQLSHRTQADKNDKLNREYSFGILRIARNIEAEYKIK